MQFLYVEDTVIEPARAWAERFTAAMQRDFAVVAADAFELPSDEGGAPAETDLIFFATDTRARRVQHWLDLARELRIPYLFLTPAMHYPDGTLTNVLAPVTMLEEEVHKAELLSHLARYTDCAVTLLPAHDYGSRARTNTGKIRTFLDTRQADLGKTFQIEEQTAKADSMSLHKELYGSINLQIYKFTNLQIDLIVWTASRDYGLDDLIFGPAERKLILHATVPVALLNPRGDLYSLCD